VIKYRTEFERHQTVRGGVT